MTRSIHIRRENIERQLAIYRNNLATLEQQAAIYGIQIPLHVINEINHARKQIESLERKLAELEGSSEVTPEIEVNIDDGLDLLLRAMQTVQTQIAMLVKSFIEDHQRLDIVWQRVHPSLQQRVSELVAILFIMVVASLWYIKDFRDALLAFPVLGMIITGSLIIAGAAIYLFGRDGRNR